MVVREYQRVPLTRLDLRSIAPQFDVHASRLHCAVNVRMWWSVDISIFCVFVYLFLYLLKYTYFRGSNVKLLQVYNSACYKVQYYFIFIMLALELFTCCEMKKCRTECGCCYLFVCIHSVCEFVANLSREFVQCFKPLSWISYSDVLA